MTKFDHNAIEKKWSQVWSDENLNKAGYYTRSIEKLYK